MLRVRVKARISGACCDVVHRGSETALQLQHYNATISKADYNINIGS
jgi:hypothetical protein